MLKIFVIFHERIFDECYENIPQHILDKYFTFFAVNKKIEKVYTPGKYNVINEWELPYYNKDFQEFGLKENSAIHHIYRNDLVKDANYVGFFQYDMYFENEIITNILNTMNNEATCFYVLGEKLSHTIYETWDEPYVIDYLTSFYQYVHTCIINVSAICPRLNSYVIPVSNFYKIMNFVSMLYPRIGNLCLKTHYNHVAVLYEIIMGFMISQEFLKMVKLDINHNHDYKKLVSTGEDTLPK